MKASPEQQRRLLDLQAIDTKLVQLAHRVKNLPERAECAALEKTISERQRSRVAKRDAADEARADLSRAESDVSLVEARLERDRTRLEGSPSAKEAQALQAEIQALTSRRSMLEDVQIEAMETFEARSRELAEADRETAELEAQRNGLREGIERAEASIRDEQKSTRIDRESIAAAIDGDLLALYDRQRERYGIGAALLTRGVSGGSNVTLSADELDEIRRADSDDVVLCPSSSAILVRTEESGL